MTPQQQDWEKSAREEFEKEFPSMNGGQKAIRKLIADFWLSNLRSREKEMRTETLKKIAELREEKRCKHDSNSHCLEEECYLYKTTGYMQCLEDIYDLLDQSKL